MTKDNIQDILIEKGRELVCSQGADSLTARKLSDISGYSVGTIYNQFKSMDNYILLQNYLTLDELYNFMQKTKVSKNPYIDINNYLDSFITFVLNNRQTWSLLFDFHLKNNSQELSKLYLRKIAMILHMINGCFSHLFPLLKKEEKDVLEHTLWLSLFSLSSFLAKDESKSLHKINRQAICKLMLNSYISGVLKLSEI